MRNLNAGERVAGESSTAAPGTSSTRHVARTHRSSFDSRLRRSVGRAIAHAGKQRRRHGRARVRTLLRGPRTAVRHEPSGTFLTDGVRCIMRSGRHVGARVVSVSSNAHQFSPSSSKTSTTRIARTTPGSAYGQSKTANVLHAVEITRRWATEGIVANALHPGAIPTNLQRYTGAHDAPRPTQDARAGGRDVGAAGGLTTARRSRRAILRGLPTRPRS